jgi:hypothetical protein
MRLAFGQRDDLTSRSFQGFSPKSLPTVAKEGLSQTLSHPTCAFPAIDQRCCAGFDLREPTQILNFRCLGDARVRG